MIKNKYNYYENANKIFRVIIRCIAQSFPGFASLASLDSEIEIDQKFNEIEDFLNELHNKLEKYRKIFDESSIDENELVALIMSICKKLVYEKRKYHRIAYAKLLSNAIIDGMLTQKAKWHFFNSLIEKLQEEHIVLLEKIVEKDNIKFEKLLLSLHISNKPKEWGMLIAILSELCNYGLISYVQIGKPHSNQCSISNKTIGWTNKWRNTIYSPLNLGKEFLNYIKN